MRFGRVFWMSSSFVRTENCRRRSSIVAQMMDLSVGVTPFTLHFGTSDGIAWRLQSTDSERWLGSNRDCLTAWLFERTEYLVCWEEIKNGDDDDHPSSSAPPAQPHGATHPRLDRLDYLSLRRYNVILERTEDGVASTIKKAGERQVAIHKK
jgi:hypothetical protein